MVGPISDLDIKHTTYHMHSTHASEGRLQACVYLPEVRIETRLHPCRCCTRPLRIWRIGEVGILCLPTDQQLICSCYSIGTWPVTVGQTKTTHTVYLSEESHFDVVLGRSFMEKRQVKTDPVDPTDVRCMDTGEKIDCELVILKDGKGQIVTVT